MDEVDAIVAAWRDVLVIKENWCLIIEWGYLPTVLGSRMHCNNIRIVLNIGGGVQSCMG